jgi:hypothetical protein
MWPITRPEGGSSMRLSPSPALVVAALALFVALGGSAFAVSQAAQPRCATGSVRGIASVTGVPSAGMANIPDKFTSSKALFSRAFNCVGGATQVRRVGVGVYEVRFAGNRAQTGLVSAGVGYAAAVSTVPDGAFRVAITTTGHDDAAEVPFMVVAV